MSYHIVVSQVSLRTGKYKKDMSLSFLQGLGSDFHFYEDLLQSHKYNHNYVRASKSKLDQIIHN